MAIFFMEHIRDMHQLVEMVENARYHAKKVADFLIEQIRLPHAAMNFSPLRSADVRFADVEDNLDKLRDQVRAADRDGTARLRCLPVGETLIPVSAEWTARARQNGDGRNTGDARPVDLPIDQALENVGKHLVPFIAQRFGSTAYLSNLLGGMGGAQMLSVVVHSRTHGDRVSYSPAYFVNYAVLASPTTPVQGVLDPGTYIFMVTSPGRKPRRDNGVFHVPPTFNISLQV